MGLHPCPSCARHVRASEPRCPFCGVGLVLDPSATAPATAARLGRAAIFAFRTATATAFLAACGPTGAPPPTETIAQPYGAPPETVPPTTTTPPPPTTTTPPATEVTPPPTTDTTTAPAYGGAPPPTPTPPPTTHARHAHEEDPGTTTAPAYGAPASAYGGPSLRGPGTGGGLDDL
jgi:hypothetical protein